MIIDSIHIKIGFTEFDAQQLSVESFNAFISEFLSRSFQKKLQYKKLVSKIFSTNPCGEIPLTDWNQLINYTSHT